MSVLTRALRGARHFALAEAVPYPTKARSQSVSGLELSPTHPSLRFAFAIMIPSLNSSVKRSGTLNHYVGDLLHTMRISGLSRVRTETFQLLVIPSSAPHPVQTNRQSPRHGYFRNLSTASHRQVEKLIAPSRIAAHRHLGRVHQQETQ